MATQAELVAAVAALAETVHREGTVEDSILAFIVGLQTQLAALADQLQHAGVPDAIVQQVADLNTALGANVDRLAAAAATVPSEGGLPPPEPVPPTDVPPADTGDGSPPPPADPGSTP
jgi:hypothetical protein